MRDPDQRTYEFGPFRLTPAEGQLLRNGETVTLTPKAFETLVLLVERQGSLFPKEELMKTLWPDTFVEEANLAHHIWRLRKALEDTKDGEKYIETVPKRGYRFIAEVRAVEGSAGTIVLEQTITRVGFEHSEIETADDNEAAKDLPTDDRVLKQQIQSTEGLSFKRPDENHFVRLSPAPSIKPAMTYFGRHKIALAVVLSTLLLVASVVAYKSFSRSSSNALQIDSIAVMPFVNESGNADMEYLSDGMTESLISSLSQLPALNVKARNSVFRFKGKDPGAKEVGRQLGVQAILTGRVVQRGQELTLYIELVNTLTENTLWKNDYHRQLTNLEILQSEIARDVARRLNAKLSPSQEQKLSKTYVSNPEAYQLVLRARYAAHSFLPGGFQKAIAYSNQALEKEPNYAPALAMLAFAYTQMSFFSPPDNVARAKEAARKALEIDDTLPEVHISLGTIKSYYDWDQSGAETEFARAVDLGPGEAFAHQAYGWHLSLMGRFDEGMKEYQQAQTLDPLSDDLALAIGQNFYWRRQPDRAIEQSLRAIELNPTYGIAHVMLGELYAHQRRFSDAVNEYQKASQLGAPDAVFHLAYAYAVSGKRAEAQKMLNEFKQPTKNYVPPLAVAVIYLGLDDKEQALQWLEKAYQARSPFLASLKVDPRFDTLRSDARFVDLEKRVGLSP